MNLQEFWQRKGYGYYPTDKGNYHSYLEEYSRLFEPIKDQEITLIEIGIAHGGSLKLFEDWMPKATIIGYDIDPQLRVPLSRANVITKDCMTFIEKEFDSFSPDIIIDDGSHKLEHQLYVIKTCYPQLKTGGYLIIEDIQDIENQKQSFDSLGIKYQLLDLRLKKNRYDDILLVFHKN
jgi:cephalosporin hydroxylase